METTPTTAATGTLFRHTPPRLCSEVQNSSTLPGSSPTPARRAHRSPCQLLGNRHKRLQFSPILSYSTGALGVPLLSPKLSPLKNPDCYIPCLLPTFLDEPGWSQNAFFQTSKLDLPHPYFQTQKAKGLFPN